MKRVYKGLFYYWMFLIVFCLVAAAVAVVSTKFDMVDGRITNLKDSSAELVQLADDAYKKPTLDAKISNVLLKHKESVVYIEIAVDPRYEDFLREQGVSPGGLGTGWFVKVDDDYAYVVTNHHVIASHLALPEMTKMNVYDIHTPWPSEAEVVGYDIIGDLAVIKVKNEHTSNWVPLKFADHSKTKEGDPVVIIGHGLGLPWSMSSGIITAMNRWMIRERLLMIQSDAVVNQGNSGGPMLNLDGEVIGVVDAILDPGSKGEHGAAYAGVSLVLAGFQVEKSVNEIIMYGETRYPSTNLLVRNPSREEYVDIWGAEPGKSLIIIAQADKDSAEYKAGFREGDFITKVNGLEVQSMLDIMNIVFRHSPGDVLFVEVMRPGWGNFTIPYTLTEYKQQ